MTVAQLIALLQTLPADFIVVRDTPERIWEPVGNYVKSGEHEKSKVRGMRKHQKIVVLI